MAVQGRGYYGIGAAKKDFGFSNNMTLPLSGGYGWSQSDAMPTEGYSDKGRASFTVDREGKVRRTGYQLQATIQMESVSLISFSHSCRWNMAMVRARRKANRGETD